MRWDGTVRSYLEIKEWLEKEHFHTCYLEDPDSGAMSDRVIRFKGESEDSPSAFMERTDWLVEETDTDVRIYRHLDFITRYKRCESEESEE